VRAWRDEIFPIVDPATLQPLARTERGAARFWGTLTFGAHATGYVTGADGRPSHLWIARRSRSKAVDPGLLDNLIGGGVPDSQTPLEALLREGWEEAGLTSAQMEAARAGSVIRLRRDIPEGLQFEEIHSFDLELPAGLLPCNQDGEVQAFSCVPVAEALALAAGTTMTVDAALVTLDFALRHALLPAPHAATLEARLAPLLRAG
jgi:8-oxo-dGTP pyrophosphatase MutT (NUDIX family)